MSDHAGTPSREARVDEHGTELEQLLVSPSSERTPSRIDGAVVGTLVAFGSDGTVPLVVYDGRPTSAALPARATLDLHPAHIGQPVVLMFEHGDPRKPIVIGRLHEPPAGASIESPGHVEVEADGQHLVVSAREQLVLRCGKASITLTRAGKILVQGEYVSNRSSGVLRLKGGSVQIN